MKTKLIAAIVLTCLMAQPARASVYVTGGLTHEHKIQPGQKYTGILIIKNPTQEPQEVKIYQTDYSFCCEGTADYGVPAGQAPRSNADWITYSPRRTMVPPDDSITVNYKVEVPDDPNLAGTYWSMLMVQAIPKNSPESSLAEIGEIKVGITQIMRYGVQMITHIGDTGERKLDFIDTKLLKQDDVRFLNVDIENVGQRWLRPFLWVELYDFDGQYIGKFDACRKRIYPGTSVRYQVDLTSVPQGDYKALVVADSGGNYIFGANYNFKFEI